MISSYFIGEQPCKNFEAIIVPEKNDRLFNYTSKGDKSIWLLAVCVL